MSAPQAAPLAVLGAEPVDLLLQLVHAAPLDLEVGGEPADLRVVLAVSAQRADDEGEDDYDDADDNEDGGLQSGVSLTPGARGRKHRRPALTRRPVSPPSEAAR